MTISGSRQFVLPIPFEPVHDFDNFYVCPGNKQAFDIFQSILANQWGFSVLFIYGESGTGKSHLLQALQLKLADSRESLLLSFEESTALHYSSIEQQRIERKQLFLVDRIDLIQATEDEELAFFDLFNIFFRAEKLIIVTSRVHPHELLQVHERLRSRLNSGHIVRIDRVDEATLSFIMKKRAADFQLEIPEKVIEYLLLRIPRSPGFVQQLLGKINEQSLSQKRPVTIPLVREILESDITVP